VVFLGAIFAVTGATKAVMFLIWCALVGLMDNALKPLLLGRGIAVPIVVVSLGAIGGFVAMGIILACSLERSSCRSATLAVTIVCMCALHSSREK